MRARLLLTTALALVAAPALAQVPPATLPGPGRLPAGMQVVAGVASAAVRGTTLQVTQGSGRAALDWSSFDIGSRATVQFRDPSAQATTLNRVTGPNASVIAGRLTSNGQVVLINPSGVVFMPGSVVDAQSVVISASGITQQAMRQGVATGHFVLDQPARPGAQVVNAGRISVRRAGLAALVAPHVANHGTISAAFGTVALSGIASHVVDLYGDGLLSIDVSRQTVQGSGGQTALVTNDGVIAAQGGRVMLSTAAVDGVVTNLVEAGGRISADSTGPRGGTVLIDAEGGAATISGTVSARGLGRGDSVGGQIAVQASGQVDLASTAVVDASGRSRGGVVAIGTTLGRAVGGVGTVAAAARLVGIAPGARVAADAMQAGPGGQVTVLSTDDTMMAGLLSARGGGNVGNGGNVEVSGTLGLSLIGHVDVTAAHGQAGGLTIDPTDLVVQSGGGAKLDSNGTLGVTSPPADNTAVIDPNTLQAATGNVTLISTDNLDVKSGFALNTRGLLAMTASNGTITVGGAITSSAGGILMTAGSDIVINSPITAMGAIAISSARGTLTQAAGAAITSLGSSVLLSAGGTVSLSAAVTGITAVDISAGTAGSGALTQNAGGPLASNTLGIALSAAGLITLNDSVQATNPTLGSLNLRAAAGVLQNAGAIVTPSLFSAGGTGIAGSVSLTRANSIERLHDLPMFGGFALRDIVPLDIAGSLSVGSGQTVSLTAPAITFGQPGASGAILAAGGTVELSPATGPATLGAAAAGFSLTQPELASIATGTLRIGQAASGGQATAITVAGGFDVTLPGAQAGQPIAGALDLEAGSGRIAIDAGLLRAGTLLLGTSGAAVEAAGAVVEAGTLGSVGAIGGIGFAETANSIGVLGAITATGGAIEVATSGTLLLSGPISTGGGPLGLSAGGSITLAGTVDIGLLSLSTRGIGDVLSTGSVSASEIGGNVAGSASLIDSYAGTTTLGGFTVGGSFALQTAGALTVGGAVFGSGTAPTSVKLSANAVLDIASAITASTIDLAASSLVETGTGSLAGQLQSNGTIAGTLTSSGLIGGDAFLLGANQLSRVQALAVDGVLALRNTRSLAIGSGVSATTASLHVTGGLLAIEAPMTIAPIGTLDLQADDLSFPAAGGMVTTSRIRLVAIAPDTSRTVVLGGNGLSDSSTLALGAVASPAALLADIIEVGGLPGEPITAAGIVVAGATFGSTTTLQLLANDGLTQTGPLLVGTLEGSIGAPGLLLADGGNSIDVLGPLFAGGNASLADAGAPSLTLAGGFSVPDGDTLALAVTGLQFGVGSLSAGAHGLVEIGPAGFGVTVAIGDAPSTANIQLGSLGAITAGTVRIGRSLALGTPFAGSIEVAGDARFGGTLDLQAASIGQGSGVLDVGSLQGVAGAVMLAGTANVINALGAFSANGLSIADTVAVQVTGDVGALNGSLTLIAPGVAIGSAGLLSASRGSVILQTDALSGNVQDGGGLVGISPFTSGTLAIGGAISLAGVTAATVQLGSLDGRTSGIVFSGPVSAGGASLMLLSTGGVSEDATGVLGATTLAGTAGSLSLPNGNAVGTLAGFTVTQGDLLLADAGNLIVAAPVVANSLAGGQTITLLTPNLTLDPGAQFTAAGRSPGALVLQSDLIVNAVNADIPGGRVAIEPLGGNVSQRFDPTGSIVADTLELGGDQGVARAAALTLGAFSFGGTQLIAETGGLLTQTGAISAPVAALSGSAAAATLDFANNLAALGSFSANGGDLRLTDAAPLGVTGVVSAAAGTLALSGPSVTQDATSTIRAQFLGGLVAGDLLLVGGQNSIAAIGALNVTGRLSLNDRTTLTEAANGQLVAGSLDGSFGADLHLDGTANSIGRLGPITATGSLSLTDFDPILAGTVSASGIALTVDGIVVGGGSLVATGAAGGPPQSFFASAGTIEIAPRDAGLLYLGAAPGAAPFVSAAVLNTVDAPVLRLGAIGADVRASGIEIDAPVTVSPLVGTVDLQAAGPGTVSEGAGGLIALSGTLVGDTGAVSLGAGNSVPELGPYAVSGGGTFTLGDTGPLAITGDVSAADITLRVNGALSQQVGSLIAPSGTVDLTAGGASQGLGIIEAAVLDSSQTPSGDFALTGANRVTALGPWRANGSLELFDAVGDGPALLTVSGPVMASTLELRAMAIQLAGDIGAGSADFATTAGGVTQTGGTLAAGLLRSNDGVLGGDVLLTAGGNAVSFLDPFAAPGHGFALTDASPLGVVGALSAGAVLLADPAGITVAAPVTASIITLRGGALVIGLGGSLLAQGGRVDLVGSGATESVAQQGGGFIQAATLLAGGTPSGAFVLGGSNDIAALGAFEMAAGGSLVLNDIAPLSVTGPVIADAVTLAAPAITVSGLMSAGSVDLSASGGGVAEIGGSIVAQLLSSSGSIVGGADLQSGGNAVAALGNILINGGDFAFAQAGSLVVAGTVAGTDIAVRIGGSLQIGAAGRLQAGGVVDLSAVGAGEAATGVVAAGLLVSTHGASGVFALDGANQVAGLGAFSMAGGTLSLTDLQPLRVTGPVGVADLSLIAPALTLAGTIAVPVADFATTAGPLVQDGGSLLLGTLSSLRGVAGTVSLTGANQIAALGAFSASGAVSLADSTGLEVAGSVAAPAGLQVAIVGDLSEGPQGSIAASSLSGQAAAVQLARPTNSIGALAFATTAGALDIADQQSLIVAALSGPGASLSVAGELTFAGPVAEGGSIVALDAAGAIRQTGGTLAAGLLQVAASTVVLPAGNAVTALGDVNAPGGFALANRASLAILGAARAGVIDLSVASGGMAEQGGGALIAGLLTSRAGIFGDTRLAGANQLAAVSGLHDSGRFQLANTQALTVGGVSVDGGTLDLSTSAGGILQTGPLVAGTLASAIGIVGGARFDSPVNQVAALGGMRVTGGDLVLTTAGNLRVAGPVEAPDISLTAGGAIGQAGDIVTPGTLSLASGGAYQRFGGALLAGTLTGVAIGVADFGAAATVQRIGAFSVLDAGEVAGATAASRFSLLDATALTLAGPLAADYVRLQASGTLVWSGDLITLGLPRLQQQFDNPTGSGTWLQVVPGPGGVSQILQAGVAHVFTQDGGLSTVRLQLPATGGLLSLGDLQAPSTDLLLFLGAGQATGRIDVGDLLVSGRLGSTRLTGVVRGLFGAAAARESDIAPFLDANYRINSCPIRSVNCILLPTEAVPQQNPLRDLSIGQARDELDDADVLLPNVAEQDY